MAEQALGGIPVGFGVVVEDKTFVYFCAERPLAKVLLSVLLLHQCRQCHLYLTDTCSQE